MINFDLETLTLYDKLVLPYSNVNTFTIFEDSKQSLNNFLNIALQIGHELYLVKIVENQVLIRHIISLTSSISIYYHKVKSNKHIQFCSMQTIL
jgi:hypothetical protein